MSRVCIAGDLQVGKHDAGYEGVKCDLDAYLGYEGIMAPRMVTMDGVASLVVLSPEQKHSAQGA